MLLLAHHERETIILETSDGPIEIRLSRLDSPRPRIGIDAPPSVRIIRKALFGGEAPAEEAEADGDGQEEEPWWRHPDDAVSGSGAQAGGPGTVGSWDDDWLE